jgi:mono/diheme cytochrome c family protein
MRRTVLCGVAILGLAVGATATPPPADGDAGRVSGAAIYLRNCAPCHGEDGRGGGPNAPLFLSQPRNLREGFLDKYPTADLARRIVDGRPLSLALDVDALRREAREVAGIDGHIRRLPTLDWIAVENGWAIYAERCGACHGAFGRPEDKLPEGVRAPRDLGTAKFQSSLDDTALTEAVRHGRKGMPALIPRLNAKEAENVVAFVRVLGPGFESYSKFCGHCHGDDGVGIGNFDETVGAPAVVFDAEYMARVDPLRLRESIWHMLGEQKPSMPHFRGQISEAEARAVVEYLRELPAAPAKSAD